MSHSTRQEQFDRAFRAFGDAHARGMRSLREGDFPGFQDAVDDERVAVENACESINDAIVANQVEMRVYLDRLRGRVI